MLKRALLLLLFCFGAVLANAGTTAAVDQSFKISEVMAGSASSSNEEYIEIINTGSSAINITGYKLTFISSSNVQKTIATFNGFINPGQIITLANYNIGFTPEYVFAASSLTYNGHLVLTDSSSNELDKLGWGTALSYEGKATAALSGGKILQRYIDCNGQLIDTVNNSEDFFINQTINVGSMPATTKADCGPPPDPKLCEGILLSEIMPNAAGSDEGHEFIEIYNPASQAMSLYGCTLKTNASSKVYEFDKNSLINANQYMAVYDTASGLSLLNSSGGLVTLSTVKNDTIVEYPAALSDDISWALISDVWQQTNQLTPNAVNLPFLEPDAVGTAEESKGSPELEPCEVGKYRNPETNRCKTIETTSSQITCPEGKYLNAATNRCKSVQLASSILTPCKPDQYRNPITNRCKNSESQEEFEPCEEGYERNTETNRCRKVTAVKASTSQTAALNDTQPAINYPIIIIFTTLTIGYGIYEYKSEIKNLFRRRINK